MIRKPDWLSFHCVVVILLLATLFFFGCIVLIIIWTLFDQGLTICASPKGIIYMQDFWFNYKALIESFFYSLSLYVAAYNLEKYINVERCKALGDIRAKLNTNEKRIIHSYLLPSDDQIPIVDVLEDELSTLHKDENSYHSNIDVFDYLGTLELGAIMLKLNVLSFNEFYNQFGYRIKNAYVNEYIRSHIEDPENDYSYLRYAIGKMRKFKKL